ncbi:sulfotransferase family 2 domain-containing protein [Gammaproteobacteria bacterium]|nr:sulfotransferase family 2 domain-containing protein [Gammaproteobacteria bacterium]
MLQQLLRVRGCPKDCFTYMTLKKGIETGKDGGWLRYVRTEGHFAPQYRRKTMEGEIVMDHLGRFENYENEMIHFLRSVGIETEIKFPHINRTRKRQHYSRNYNGETKKIVQRRYNEDIELFDC